MPEPATLHARLTSWLDSLPGPVSAATHDGALEAAREAAGMTDVPPGDFARALWGCGYRPEWRAIHGEEGGHLWLIPLPGG